MENQKRQGGVYGAKTLGRGRMLLLGLQHMFAIFGMTVLVPILVSSYSHDEGLSVQMTLFMAGAGALFFHLCPKFKVPAFLGSSFVFLGGFATVAKLNTGIYANMSYGEKLPYACGSIVVAGLLYLVLAAVIKPIGAKRVIRFLPSVVAGPIIIHTELSLVSTAISSAETSQLLALVTLCMTMIFNIWGKGIFHIIPILMGVVIAYVATLIFYAIGPRNANGSTIIDFSKIMGSSVFGVPPFRFCKFDLTTVLVMAPIAIATMMEHIDDISAILATVGENFIEDPGLRRTLVGGGLTAPLSTFFGGPANTTYGKNTGVLELSHIYDPRIIRLATLYAILLSFMPHFVAALASLPATIIGGISFIPYGMILTIDVRNVVENRVDFSNNRNLVIAAAILVSDLGFSKGLSFTVLGTSITLAALTTASIAGVLLDVVPPRSDYHFGESRRGDTMRDVSMKN